MNPQKDADVKGESTDAPLLEPFFITPTFVKVFDNAHIQMTWHNAYMDLAEATEVVFIGYSLPQADYHFRTLLRRSVRQSASIVAVLTREDEEKRSTPRALRGRGLFAADRYREFFGPGRVRFHFEGAKAYFEGTHGKRKINFRMRGLRRRFKSVKGPVISVK